MVENRVMLADSYKYSQPPQYPGNMIGMYDYMEARKNKTGKVVFFGAQYILKEYFSTPITIGEVMEAYRYAEGHGEPFDLGGWTYIVHELGGMLPVKISSLPEGGVYPTGVPLMVIQYTDEKVAWVVGWLETVLMKVWYPTAVATKSYEVRQLLLKYAEMTQDNPFVDFQYHNFGDRGSTCVEAAGIGGVAHLTQFLGTDNFNSLRYCEEFYNNVDDPLIAGYSIPATEHSTVTSWGREGEFDFYDNFLEINKERDLIACVVDSYDPYKATDYLTSGEYKEKVESEEYPNFVLRPDSGEPEAVVTTMIRIMEANNVAFTVNDKGFKVFTNYSILWGDGITPHQIAIILHVVTQLGYSSSIMAFGSGGDLMQNVNRDTNGFAVKCSSITLAYLDGVEEREVYKDPITDPGKKSKRGKVAAIRNSNGVYSAGYAVDSRNAMEVIYLNGKLMKTHNFEEIRKASR